MRAKRRKILMFFLLVTYQSNAYLPVCDGSCPECTQWMPMLKNTAQNLKSDYMSTETRLSERYNNDIHQKLEEREKLLKIFEKLLAELQAIDKLISLETKKHYKERKDI